LAEVLGDPTLVRPTSPGPSDFHSDRVSAIAEAWLRFNRGYSQLKDTHFQKYARRLGEEMAPSQDSARLPTYVLPPYVVAADTADPWWRVSAAFWNASRAAAGSENLVRVVATTDAASLARLVLDCEEENVAVWVSGLDEFSATPSGRRALRDYGRSIRQTAESGRRLFALYGGFFSVLMSASGLRGSSHGIGYGEAREWLELPRSGPAPARYYLPLAHRYVSQDLASILWEQARELAECVCSECRTNNPALLSYQSLMKHSVYCRRSEIDTWVGLTSTEQVERLRRAYRSFEDLVSGLDAPRSLQRQADNCYQHLNGWIDVLARP